MWQQWTTQGFQLHQVEQNAAEESGHFLSFAKRSREVHRHAAVTVCLPARGLHHSSSLSQYGEEFWENILRYPSEKAACYDLLCGDPLNMFSRKPAEMVCTGVREENLSVNTLPSPAQLMGKRRKGGGQRGDAAQRKATAVTQHIGDLRRKQNVIEQMKKEKWWGSTVGYTPETNCSSDVGNWTSPETLWSLDASHTHTEYNTPPTHLNTGTVTPQVFDGRDVMMAPGGNPMMPFVVTGTAHREAQRDWDTPPVDTLYEDTPHLDTCYLDTPHQSHTEFWGFPSII